MTLDVGFYAFGQKNAASCCKLRNNRSFSTNAKGQRVKSLSFFLFYLLSSLISDLYFLICFTKLYTSHRRQPTPTTMPTGLVRTKNIATAAAIIKTQKITDVIKNLSFCAFLSPRGTDFCYTYYLYASIIFEVIVTVTLCSLPPRSKVIVTVDPSRASSMLSTTWWRSVMSIFLPSMVIYFNTSPA